MKTNQPDIFTQNKIFGWIGAGAMAILLVPLISMQFSNDVQWGLADFIIVGILLFSMGSAYVLVARRNRNHRVILAVLFLLALFYLYAELAVGIFTNIGG